MNLKSLLDYIIDESKTISLVNSAFKGNPYESWNSGEVRYGSFCIAVESFSRDSIATYNLVAYYGDRLTQDKSNLYEIQTDTVNVLNSLINSLEEIGEVTTPYTINFFEQQFNDYLAGGYVRFSINVESEVGNCGMENF